MKLHTLEPSIHQRNKSFYGKAKFYTEDDWCILRSYETDVCKIRYNANGDVEFVRLPYMSDYNGKDWSATTQRHVDAFLYHAGKENYIGKANWCAMPIGQIITL